MKKTRFIIPNAFTSMNFLLGVFAICWATGIFSDFTDRDPFRMSAYFVVLCVLLDKLDGFAARLVNASSEFGAQFDSLADLIAFGLAPAFGLFFSYMNYAKEWSTKNFILLIVVFSVYVLCAAMRLAKYNAMDSTCLTDYFSGLPSTFAGAINVIILSYFIFKGGFTTAATSPNLLFIPLFIMLLTALLMVSPLFLPKLKPRDNKAFNAFQFVMVIIVYILGFMFISPNVPFIHEALILIMSAYLIIGFGIGLYHREQILIDCDKKIEDMGK